MLITRILFLCAFSLVSTVSHAGTCDDPLRSSQTCYEMQNLRSHILMLEAQRDLMQVNYPYINVISNSLANRTDEMLRTLPSDFKDHEASLKGLVIEAQTISKMAEQRDSNVFQRTNTIRSQCMSCHNTNSASSGYRWTDIFKTDWSKIVARCNSAGRNPYMCKQMHGMITNYAYINSAFFSQKSDNEVLSQSAAEIARIAKDLLDNNFQHVSQNFFTEVQVRAKAAAQAARKSDPSALEKAQAITQSCLECHGSTSNQGKSLKQLSLFNYNN